MAVVLVWGLWLVDGTGRRDARAVTFLTTYLHFSSLLLSAKGCLSCRLVSNSTLLGDDVCLHLP